MIERFGIRAIAIALAVVAIVLLLGIRSCQSGRVAKVENRINSEQLEAASESGRDAVATAGKANERERSSEELGRQNEKEIRNAEGANDKVGAGVGRAGVDSLCRRAAYRDTERCKLRQPPSR